MADKILKETRLTKIKATLVPWYLSNNDVKRELNKQDTYTKKEIAKVYRAKRAELLARLGHGLLPNQAESEWKSWLDLLIAELEGK